MVWNMGDGGVVDLFHHSPKENIGANLSPYADQNLVAIMVTPVAILEHSCSEIVLSVSLKR